MTEYSFQVYSFYIEEGKEKGVNKFCDFDDYPSAMTCYKEYREEIHGLIKKHDIKDWFVILSRIYIKGKMRFNTNIKYEGTL